MEGDLTLGGEHIIQYTDDVSQNCAPETYIILLTSVTPINSIKKYKQMALFVASKKYNKTKSSEYFFCHLFIIIRLN